MLLTRMCSLKPGTPGRRQQMPRTTRSICTPALEAAYVALERLRDVLAASQVFQRRLEVLTLAARKKTETPKIDAQNRNVPAVEEASSTQECSVAAKRDQRIEL